MASWWTAQWWVAQPVADWVAHRDAAYNAGRWQGQQESAAAAVPEAPGGMTPGRWSRKAAKTKEFRPFAKKGPEWRRKHQVQVLSKFNSIR